MAHRAKEQTVKKFLQVFWAAILVTSMLLGTSAQASIVSTADPGYGVTATQLCGADSFCTVGESIGVTMTPINLPYGTINIALLQENISFGNAVSGTTTAQMVWTFAPGQLSGATLVTPNKSYEGHHIGAMIVNDTVVYDFVGVAPFLSSYDATVTFATGTYPHGPVTATFSFFGLAGQISNGFATPLVVTRDDSKAATPIPEPETWVLLLAGLGALSFVACRQQYWS